MLEHNYPGIFQASNFNPSPTTFFFLNRNRNYHLFQNHWKIIQIEGGQAVCQKNKQNTTEIEPPNPWINQKTKNYLFPNSNPSAIIYLIATANATNWSLICSHSPSHLVPVIIFSNFLLTKPSILKGFQYSILMMRDKPYLCKENLLKYLLPCL